MSFYFTALSSWQLCCVGPKYQSPHFEQPDAFKPNARMSKTRATIRMDKLRRRRMVLSGALNGQALDARRAPHANAVHSISTSNAIGQDATGTKVRVGGSTGKKRA
jgi:hypothetical protein